jgi:NADH-quinone oxidoreductase subunit L
MELDWLWWIPGLPLVGSLVCGVLHALTLRARQLDPEAKGPAAKAGIVAAAAVGLAFVLAIRGFLAIRGEDTTAISSSPWNWIPIDGTTTASVAMLLDRLSGAMALVVTGVGFLIHVYATGYMKGDPGYAKFFAFLNLFVAMMLVLILSSSIVGTFIGWEGVGLCSYLLIGFWYSKQGGWPAEAGQKAFVMNRIGDASFLLGMFLLFKNFGAFDYASINAAAEAAHSAGGSTGQLALAALLLFGGACGKSAQLPLFTWLPDAMAGPTPVSALIHAATMVTSGIYLVIRLNPLFALSPEVMYTVAVVGALTAFIAGSSALVQRDLKGVLAYSTVSQLGYMFLALGSGAWVAALFHVITHAFFKALLFLGAGSVIHGMHEEQDMHRMGGLRRHMPRTFITFAAGAAALSGLPLLSGFFSKDEILARVFAGGGTWYLLWAVGLGTAALTAFYTWRMVALTFFGPERFDPDTVHPHESPAVMTVPLLILAVLSVVGGVMGLPHVFHLPHLLHEWLEPVTHAGDAILYGSHPPHLAVGTEWLLLGLGALVALVFAHLGFHAHRHGLAADEAFQAKGGGLVRTLNKAWGVDEAYQRAIVAPVKLLAVFIAVVVDQLGIDGAVNAVGRGARSAGTSLKRFADGSIAGYGLWMGAGAAALALILTWMGA